MCRLANPWCPCCLSTAGSLLGLACILFLDCDLTRLVSSSRSIAQPELQSCKHNRTAGASVRSSHAERSPRHVDAHRTTCNAEQWVLGASADRHRTTCVFFYSYVDCTQFTSKLRALRVTDLLLRRVTYRALCFVVPTGLCSVPTSVPRSPRLGFHSISTGLNTQCK